MKKQFMVLLHGVKGGWDRQTEAEQEEVMSRYHRWSQKLREEGRLTQGSPLTENYRSIKCREGKLHVDGPYAETKEILTGYFTLKADSLDEATEISKGCPALTHGDWVQVYEMPVSKEQT